MSDDSFQPLASAADWQDALARSQDGPILLFKHSAACPLSGKADREMQELLEKEDLPIYKLVVQESRSLSDEIAETLGIRHETPQVILLHQEEPRFDTSHFDVTVDTVRDALRDAAPSS